MTEIIAQDISVHVFDNEGPFLHGVKSVLTENGLLVTIHNPDKLGISNLSLTQSSRFLIIVGKCPTLIDKYNIIERTKETRALMAVIIDSFDELSAFEELQRLKQIGNIPGFIARNDTVDEFSEAIIQIISGNDYTSPVLRDIIIKYYHHPFNTPTLTNQVLEKLTDREQAVARLIAKGLTNKKIAEELEISEKTVKTHVSNLFRKSGKNRQKIAIEYSK